MVVDGVHKDFELLCCDVYGMMNCEALKLASILLLLNIRNVET